MVPASTLVPQIVTVVSMLALELYLLLFYLPRQGPVPTVAKSLFLAVALFGSAGILLAFYWLVLYPNLNSATILFEAFGVTMGFPPGLWMIAIIVYRDRRIDVRSWAWPALLATLATAGELLMGLLLVVSVGAPSGPVALLAATVTSPWYLGSMAAAMVALLLWLPLPRPVRAALLGLAAGGLAVGLAPWSPLAAAATSGALMLATFGVAFVGRPAPREAAREFAPTLTFLVAGFLAMSVAGTAAAFAAGAPGALLLYGSVGSAVMLLELAYVLRLGLLGLAPQEPAIPIPVPSPSAGPAA
jgi:hypothetical protein